MRVIETPTLTPRALATTVGTTIWQPSASQNLPIVGWEICAFSCPAGSGCELYYGGYHGNCCQSAKQPCRSRSACVALTAHTYVFTEAYGSLEEDSGTVYCGKGNPYCVTTIAEDGASPGHDLTIVSCLTAVDTQAVDGIVKYDCLDWTKKAYCREGQTSTSSTTSSSRLNLTSSIPSSTTQSTASKANNSNATPSSTGSPSHAGGTSPGTVAGIVIASVIVTLGLISFALFSLRNRRRKQKYMALAAPIELPVPISGWGARGRNSIQRVGTGGALEMEVGNPVHVEESAYTDVSGSQAGQPSRS